MFGNRVACAGVATLVLTLAQGTGAQQADDKIASALSAAPEAIGDAATVMAWDGSELRSGSNGWTCFPDVPGTPGDDPMCLDGEWVKWAEAWQGRTEPEITRLGLAYMLAGGTDASNTDPYATEPEGGEAWVRSGPHVMVIVPDLSALEGITTDPENGGPWVMWKGTPYAHIMMPVAGSH